MFIPLSIRRTILLCLAVLLIAQALFMPIMLTVVFGIIWLSLYLSFKKNQNGIAKIWTLLLTLCALISIYWSYKTFLGVEAGVAVLSTFLFAKALESKNKRDVIILFNFALFVMASCFLLSQSFAMALVVLLGLIICFVGLYRLQIEEFETISSNTKHSFSKDFGHVGNFILYALPFFIILFLFFPRLAPLWHVPIQEQKGVTGMSDSMSPGDLAELSQSTALAFRIVGDLSKMPPRSELYWRAMVLDEYDGRKWTSSFINQRQMPRQNALDNPTTLKFDYQYLAADPKVQWIMSLEKSLPMDLAYQLRQDWSIVPNRLNLRTQPIPLKWLGDAQISHPVRTNLFNQINTRVILERDQQAQSLAKQLFQLSEQQPERYIQNVLQWYKQNGFSYTLSPGTLGNNRVDDFLFQSRQGFCEHYASSFAMLMRYVGIPARIVVGYQGGQFALDRKSWEVRQLDAHAWTEVFLNGVWQRYDPTAMIAPQRIDEGMQNYMDLQNNQLGLNDSEWKFQQYNVLKKMRIWSDYASYQWQSKVVGYNAESQQNWLKKLGLQSSYALIPLMLGTLSLILLVYFMWMYKKRLSNFTEMECEIKKFSKKLNLTQQKNVSETFQAWMQRLAEPLADEERIYFKRAADIQKQLSYSPEGHSSQKFKLFKASLKKCTDVLKN